MPPFITAYVLLFFLLAMNSCGESLLESNIQNPVIIAKDTVIFGESVALGSLEKGIINEASGIAMSILNKESLWTHNDSGDSARLFLIDTLAQHRMTCTIKGAFNRDWEDIATAKDPSDNKNKIFIGDIGDNFSVHKYSTIYIIEEPLFITTKNVTIDLHSKITFKYQDGPRDAETLMVDPTSGDIFIISKREANVNLYLIPYPYNLTDTLVAEKILTLPYTQIVAGDISFDGKEILLKNYQYVWYWSRKNGMSVLDALSRKPFETSYVQEPQGEAVCWSRDAKAFYTISEESPFKLQQVLYKYLKR